MLKRLLFCAHLQTTEKYLIYKSNSLEFQLAGGLSQSSEHCEARMEEEPDPDQGFFYVLTKNFLHKMFGKMFRENFLQLLQNFFHNCLQDVQRKCCLRNLFC